MVQEFDCWAWMNIPKLVSWVRGWCRGEREKEQEQQQQEQRSWCSLPDDILREISSHLYAGDYNTFCAVCKAWRSAAIIKTTPTVDLLGKLFSEEESGTPLLLQPPASGTMCTIFHPIRNAIYGIQIPELSGAHVHFSDHGWLLLTRDVDFSAFFLNPFTRQRIELPKPPCRYVFMSFFEPPTSRKCVVVGLGLGIFGATLEFGQGQQDWKDIEFGGEHEFMPFMSAPISYKGLIYFLCGKGVMILDVNKLTEEGNDIVDILESPFSEEEFSNMCHSWCEGFIVMDKDEVMLVYALQHWKKFQIFKWDVMKDDWQRMDSLPPNKMLFVSSHGMSLLESSAIKGTGNKIYIPMLHQGNTIFYSITRGKYHSFYYAGSGSSSSSSSSPADDGTFNCGFTRQLHGIWIKPSLCKDKSSALMFKDDFCERPPLSTQPVLSLSSCSPPPLVSKSRPPHPWLICYGGEDMPNPILSSIRSGTTRIIPMEIQSKSICASSYGCLVVKEEGATTASNNVQYFVLDVATGQRTQLPSVMDFCWKACLLSASLSDSNCHVIFIDYDKGWMMFCKLGDDVFVKVDYTSIMEDFWPFMAIGRKIYGYSVDDFRNLCILEILEGSTIRLMVRAQLPDKIFPSNCNSRSDYLIESFGEIFWVFALRPILSTIEGPATIDFAIYKVDLDSTSYRSSELECAKVEDIGAQAIFLHDCDRYGTFCSASEPTIKENSIYYLDKHNSMIYVWDLKLRNVTMLYPCAGVDGDCTVSWVMMQEATCSET